MSVQVNLNAGRRPSVTIVTPPTLWPSVATPLGEIEHIKELHIQLLAVTYNVEAFQAALLLHQFASARPAQVDRDVARRWVFLAAAECVFQLHHLKVRLAAIKAKKLRPCASIYPLIDVQRAREAAGRLNKLFPDVDALRNALAHAAANGMHPEAHAPNGQFGLTGFAQPGVFSAPFQGVMRSLRISNDTLAQINEVVSDYFLAFVPAAHELARAGHLD